jgi:hypothetical protein
MAHVRAWKAYGALSVGVVSIAWSAIFVRWTQMPGITSAFYRVLVGAERRCRFFNRSAEDSCFSGCGSSRARIANRSLSALEPVFRKR